MHCMNKDNRIRITDFAAVDVQMITLVVTSIFSRLLLLNGQSNGLINTQYAMLYNTHSRYTN